MSKIMVWGVAIDNVTLTEAIKQALKPSGQTCLVMTPNAVMLDACRKDCSLARLLNRATLSLPDGIGTLLVAKRAGTPLKQRVSGIAFGEELLKKAAQRGRRVFLLGGKPGVAQRAARRLKQAIPELRICGTHHGYFQKAGKENEAILEKIRSCHPDILLVGFGFPLQEQWMCDNLSALPFLQVAAGLGGSFDVWAGDVRRAPRAIRALGMEWAWRMLFQPHRLRHLPAVFHAAFYR